MVEGNTRVFTRRRRPVPQMLSRTPQEREMNAPTTIDREDIHVAVLAGSDSLAGETSDSLAGRAEDPDRRLILRGNNDCWKMIPKELRWSLCYLGPNYFRRARRWDLSGCSVILNQISDADQNPKTLRVAERITANYRDRLINDPRLIMKTRRDDVARALQGTPSLHVPKVIRMRNPTLARLHARIETEGFRFPAIVRQAGRHSGGIVGVFHKPEELNDCIGTLKGEYYFTEFADFRWSDGLYRKMRLFSIGGDVMLRHVLIADGWNIHAATARDGIMRERADLRDEERSYLEGGREPITSRAREMMAEVTRRLKLDYFGLDCGPTEDGQLILFEANATMQFLSDGFDPRFSYSQLNAVEDGKEALHRLMLRRAVPLRQQ